MCAQDELNMVTDLRDAIKQLQAELKEANTRVAILESEVLNQQMASTVGAVKRKVRFSTLMALREQDVRVPQKLLRCRRCRQSCSMHMR
jgi:2-oxoglutarate dehydrogenase complex dehydrogenase (E1) component-like enzyme